MERKTIIIPDWVDDQTNIYITAGIEPFMKRVNKVWYKKVVRCIKCGKCCMNVPNNWVRGQGKDGNCQHLKFSANEYLCNLKAERPFICCVGDGWEDECSIVWEKVK